MKRKSEPPARVAHRRHIDTNSPEFRARAEAIFEAARKYETVMRELFRSPVPPPPAPPKAETQAVPLVE